jgi:DNA/RNA endonuclease YhcR with UshA esterase domain
VKIGQTSEDDISTLIKFYDVQFSNTVLGSTFADGINKTDANRTLVDCSKKEFLVRSSGYAKFAVDTLPSKNGELTCVLGIYKTDYQGFIRSLKDINFKNERCGTSTGNETLVTIKSLRDLYTSGQTGIPDKTKIKGVVISDRSNLNTDTKNVVLQDATGGIVVRFDANHSFNLNDEVEVAVSKLEMSEYSKLLQIANTSVDLAKKTGSSSIVAREVNVGQILANAELWESTLVYIKDASLTGGSIYKDTKIYVDDGTGSINLYTRSVASFASTSIPTSKVNITGIIGQFNDNYQLSVRNIDDVKDAGGGNPGTEIFKDDFESGLGKWNAVSEKGAQVWVLDATHGNPGGCAKMSGFATINNENEDWLISPKIDLTAVATGALYFDNAKNYTGNDLEVVISKNYSGSGSPSGATWTQLSFAKSGGSWNYVSSGKIDLSAYNGSNVYLAFKYTSTTSASSTWELDNVKVVK